MHYFRDIIRGPTRGLNHASCTPPGHIYTRKCMRDCPFRVPVAHAGAWAPACVDFGHCTQESEVLVLPMFDALTHRWLTPLERILRLAIKKVQDALLQ